jgi:hypothetical protein
MRTEQNVPASVAFEVRQDKKKLRLFGKMGVIGGDKAP